MGTGHSHMLRSMLFLFLEARLYSFNYTSLMMILYSQSPTHALFNVFQAFHFVSALSISLSIINSLTSRLVCFEFFFFSTVSITIDYFLGSSFIFFIFSAQETAARIIIKYSYLKQTYPILFMYYQSHALRN